MRFRRGVFPRMLEVLVLAALGASGTVPAFALETHRFNIPEEAASAAIRDFAAQSHLQILVAGENVKGKKLHAIRGSFSTEEALNRLLYGTGLTHKYVGDGSVALIPIGLTDDQHSGQGSAQPGTAGKGGQESSGSFRLAQAAQGSTQGASSIASSSAPETNSGELVAVQEVIVTARKKSERIEDVPIPISVINADQLAETNQTLIRDYYSSVPGLTVQPGLFGQQSVYIRGIGIGAGAPTVGITIDDVPYGPSSDWTGGGALPDFDPGDLSHIEELRGPQGTLYGANAMGGLIKFVTKDPSTSGFSSRFEAGTDGVYNGAEPGFSLRGSANIPVSDDLAVRVSGFTRQDPGYIDNPVTNQTGVNEGEVYGGRGALFWAPTDTFSLKVTAMYQQSRTDGSPEVVVGPGLSYFQNNLLPGIQGDGLATTVQAYSAIMKARLGSVDVTSVTGYNETHDLSGFDFSSYQYYSGAALQYFGVRGSGFLLDDPERTFTQELRFSGSLGHMFDWLVGGFYKHDRLDETDNITAADPETGKVIGILEYDYSGLTTGDEYAGFADLTYHVFDRFDIQLGGRETHDSLLHAPFGSYPSPLVGPAPISSPGGQASSTIFTYSASPQYKITDDGMVYARVASGYRPGGFNLAVLALEDGAPPEYKPDRTVDYELGTKFGFWDHRLSVDASIYRINWSSIQIGVIAPYVGGPSYTANAGNAKSQGVELSVDSTPMRGLKIAGWVDYDDAVLTDNFPAISSVVGLSGARLLYVPEVSGHLSSDGEVQLGGGIGGFAGAEASYVGNRVGNFTVDNVRQVYPAYTSVEFHIGVKGATWRTTAYINNAFNARGLLNGGLGTNKEDAFFYITPRTIGLSLVKEF